MIEFDIWWNSAAADTFRAKNDDMDGEQVRAVWDAAMLAAAPSAPPSESDKEDAELTPEMLKAAVHEWECAPASVSGEEIVKTIYAAIRAARAKKERK